MLDKVKQFVFDSFSRAGKNENMDHFERTLFWLEQIKPTVDESMKIAAYAHDIARAFRKTDTLETFKNKKLNDLEVLRRHQRDGAEIISRFLRESDYHQENIERIYNMVNLHEEGGDEESDLIKDADSVSFLEVNTDKFLNKYFDDLGKDKIKEKFDWMFDRITGPEARAFAKPFYDRAILELSKK